MRKLQATLHGGTVRQERSFLESLFGKASATAAIELVKDRRIKHVQERLLLKWDSLSPSRKRGIVLFLTLLIGLIIGGGFWFRKRQLKGQLPIPSTRKRERLFFLAALISSGVGVGLWFRKRQQTAAISQARKPEVSIFIAITPPPVVSPSERAIYQPAATALPRPTIVPQDEPVIQQTAAATFPEQSPVERTPVSLASFPEPPPVERTPVSSATKGGLYLLALLMVLAIGGGLWFGILNHPTAHPAARLPIVSSSTSATHTVPAGSPIVTETYNGSIYDLAGNIRTSMSLTKFQENQGKISGYLTLGPKLQGSGVFSGSIDSVKHFQFMVIGSGAHIILIFSGVMQSTTTLSGDYYSCRQAQGNQCLQTSGAYGIWSVILAP